MNMFNFLSKFNFKFFFYYRNPVFPIQFDVNSCPMSYSYTLSHSGESVLLSSCGCVTWYSKARGRKQKLWTVVFQLQALRGSFRPGNVHNICFKFVYLKPSQKHTSQFTHNLLCFRIPTRLKNRKWNGHKNKVVFA